MAVWQYSVLLVPRESALTFEVDSRILSQTLDDINFWTSFSSHEELLTELARELDGVPSWNSAIKIFKDASNSNYILVLDIEGNLEEFTVRIDLRENFTRSLEFLEKLGEKYELKCIAADYELLKVKVGLLREKINHSFEKGKWKEFSD